MTQPSEQSLGTTTGIDLVTWSVELTGTAEPEDTCSYDVLLDTSVRCCTAIELMALPFEAEGEQQRVTRGVGL